MSHGGNGRGPEGEDPGREAPERGLAPAAGRGDGEEPPTVVAAAPRSAGRPARPRRPAAESLPSAARSGPVVPIDALLAQGQTGAALLAALAARRGPHGRVTAVSMMKDEAPGLLEWVAHHLCLGFTDLVVYTNDCSDGTDLMLERLEALGLAHHRVNAIPPGLRPQPSALNHAEAEPLVRAADWLMVFDADEFLSIRLGGGSIDDLLTAVKAEGANGIVVTWRIFGSAGQERWSPAPVTEQFLRAAPPFWNKGWGVKTLFRHDPESWRLGIHRPKLRKRVLESGFPDTVRWLNGSGRPMDGYFRFHGWRSIIRTVGYDWAQMNHYALKSAESYALRKLRGNVNLKKDKYDAGYWALQDRNETEDRGMLRYAAARGRILAALMADPELGRLHRQAVAATEARLDALRATPAHAALLESLRAAAAVPIAAVSTKPPRARDPARVAARMAAAGVSGDGRPAGAPRLSVPVSPYLARSEGMQGDARWTANQGIALPSDPAIFTAEACAQIAAGKFARGLARVLPRLLPQGARRFEIGAGCGFLAAHLARARPDLAQCAMEPEPGLRALLREVWARTGLASEPRLRLDEGEEAPALAAFAPTILHLGTPGPGAEALALVTPPSMLFLDDRLLAAHPDAAAEFAPVAARFGLMQRLRLPGALLFRQAAARPGSARS